MERVAVLPRLLRVAEAAEDVGCQRRLEPRLPRQHAHVGRELEQVAAGQKLERKKANQAKAELPQPVADDFRS